MDAKRKPDKMKYISRNGISDVQKINAVKEIFSTITGKYDFLNHFLSLRRDVFWRRFAVRKMRFFRTHRLLDVATGSADLAIEASRSYPNIQVFGVDFVKEMLDLAREKIDGKMISTRVWVLRGNALHLPFPSNTFDAAGMAFGIRNIPDKFRCLKEMARVVVPGGQVLFLEMTFPQNPYIGNLYDIYLDRILPLLARAFSPNPLAYYYLGESIINFPSPQKFMLMMKRVGLTHVAAYPLTFGICNLFVGQKAYDFRDVHQ